MKKAVLMLLLLSSALAVKTVVAQEIESADPADVGSIDAVIHSLYEVISGGIDEPRDWDRMRSLFIDEAQLIPSGTRPDGSRNGFRVMSVEEWITEVGPLLMSDGFFETETHRVTEQFGHVAHAFSTYDSRHSADDEEPFSRGINSFQLFNDGARWWVVSVYWTAETPNLAIPEKYEYEGDM